MQHLSVISGRLASIPSKTRIDLSVKYHRRFGGLLCRGLSSFLLDISSEHVETNSCKNQSDLARALESRFHSRKAFKAFERIDRALFLPSNNGEYREPYANKPQSLGHGNATMSSPLHLAQVLDWLHVHANLSEARNVLDVGCGSGWLTAAIFASIDENNGRVFSVDRIPELLVHAKTSLLKCPVTKHGMENNNNNRRIILLDAYTEKGEFNLESIKQASSPSLFDVIHVGFTFDPKQDEQLVQSLCGLLSSSKSRMLAGWGHDLCLFDNKGFRKEIAHIPGMAGIEYGVYVKPMSRSERMEKAKKALDEWKTEFEAKHKRKPSKDDLFGDAKAAQLFKDFSSATKLA